MSSQFDFSQNGVDGKAEKGECEELGERNGSQWENMRACLEGKEEGCDEDNTVEEGICGK